MRRIIWALAFLFIFIAITPFGNQDAVQYIERTSGQLKTEKIAGEAWLRWLYQNPVGEATLSTLVKRKFVSEWYGNMMDSPDSKDKIASSVDEYQIDLSQAEKQYFKSFNDFFTRKLKPEFRPVNQIEMWWFHRGMESCWLLPISLIRTFLSKAIAFNWVSFYKMIA